MLYRQCLQENLLYLVLSLGNKKSVKICVFLSQKLDIREQNKSQIRGEMNEIQSRKTTKVCKTKD